MRNIEALDLIVPPVLRAARIPGAALAVVAEGETLFANGYGYRDLQQRLPLTGRTIFPIASTSKALNAVLIGMLVDEGRLAWDVPVQQYLPQFQLSDPLISAQVTLRDLLAMRTGLPRHDWVWLGHPMSRPSLVSRLRHLPLSAGFRERFQYSNISATSAGHIAEVVTGQSWEELVSTRLLKPLGMPDTGFVRPAISEVTLSYHENSEREVLPSIRLSSDVTAPSGGSIHSTVQDFTRWMLLNLADGEWSGRRLLRKETLAEIHAPQVAARMEQGAPSARAAYALGWYADTYRGHGCLSHGGYLHDVNSEVLLFPEERIGIVAFINFGFPALARFIALRAFDALMGLSPAQSIDERLAQYEKRVAETRVRNNAVRRCPGTRPSHAMEDYLGAYEHPGYGRIVIVRSEDALVLERGDLELPLEHWHYDAWIAKDTGQFFIHLPHAFDRASRILFHTGRDGDVEALSMALEPAVAPIRFQRTQ